MNAVKGNPQLTFFTFKLSEVAIFQKLFKKHACFEDIVDGGADGTNQDVDNDGMDDDDPDDDAANVDNKPNFGLDDTDVPGALADDSDSVVKNTLTYTVYWNVAESEPITVTPARTKTINVIVLWLVKDEPRQISMSVIRMKEE